MCCCRRQRRHGSFKWLCQKNILNIFLHRLLLGMAANTTTMQQLQYLDRVFSVRPFPQGRFKIVFNIESVILLEILQRREKSTSKSSASVVIAVRFRWLSKLCVGVYSGNFARHAVALSQKVVDFH